MKKVLIVAAICLPPSLIGPAIVMGNLLRYFPAKIYSILMGHPDKIWCMKDFNSTLPCTYFYSRYPVLVYKGGLLRRLNLIGRDVFVMGEIFLRCLKIIKNENIKSLFVVADHFVEVAALIAGRLSGKKVYLWLPDIYYRPDKSDWTNKATKILEPFVIKSADRVFVTSEATQEYYVKRYGIKTNVLPHTTHVEEYKRIRNTGNNDKFSIVFTGSVEKYNAATIRDLTKVIDENPEFNAELTIVTNFPKAITKELCARYPCVKCVSATRNEIPKIQKSADLLFLPLSFEEHPAIVLTASPSKLPEYLAAGRPVLVYAPPESYYVKYAKKNGWGFVVDKPDNKLLGDALRKIQKDKALREKLVAYAKKTLLDSHDAKAVSSRLQKFLSAG